MFENEVDEKQLHENLLEKNSKEQLATRLITHMKMLNAAEPTILWAKTYHLSWRNLPFIPEDLGFKEHIQKPGNMPKIRIYHRDGISCTKKFDGKWSIVKGKEFKMEFDIPSKFHAFMIFSGLGIEFKDSDSTVPDTLNKPISEIIKNAKEEEE